MEEKGKERFRRCLMAVTPGCCGRFALEVWQAWLVRCCGHPSHGRRCWKCRVQNSELGLFEPPLPVRSPPMEEKEKERVPRCLMVLTRGCCGRFARRRAQKFARC